MKLNFSLFIFLLFGLSSCHKNTPATCPAPATHSVPTFYRQFNFKKGSKWVYKNSSSGAVDTMSVWVSDGFQTYQQTSGNSKQCPSDYLESYTCELLHKMFLTSNAPSYYGEFYYWYSNFTTPTFMNVFQQNVGDSIKFTGNPTQYIKLENHFPTLVLNGTTFIDVYQMFYSPDLQGFKRLWWCPNIGIVQCEFVNNTTHLTEDWTVTTFTVQLY